MRTRRSCASCLSSCRCLRARVPAALLPLLKNLFASRSMFSTQRASSSYFCMSAGDAGVAGMAGRWDGAADAWRGGPVRAARGRRRRALSALRGRLGSEADERWRSSEAALKQLIYTRTQALAHIIRFLAPSETACASELHVALGVGHDPALAQYLCTLSHSAAHT